MKRVLIILLLTIIPGSQGYSFGMSVHKNHTDTCDNSSDQEALESMAVAIIEVNLQGDGGEDSEDDRRRKLRGTVERELTVRCDNGGYCLCPDGKGCGSFWCKWCTARRRRLASNTDMTESIESEVKTAFANYITTTCWGPAIDIEIEL